MKRSLMVAAAVAATALILAGCKMGGGIGKTSGNKYDRNFETDATGSLTVLKSGDEELNGMTENTEASYRRYWEEFSNNEATAAITVTLTPDYSKSDLTTTKKTTVNTTGETKYAVIGYLYDINWHIDKDSGKEQNSGTIDFNIIGIQPETGKFYHERYVDVKKKAKTLDTNFGTLGTLATNENSGFNGNIDSKTGGAAWNDKYATDLKKKDAYTIKIMQDKAGKYNVTINGKDVGTFDKTSLFNKSEFTHKKKGSNIKNASNIISGYDADTDYMIGGCAGYLNCPAGTKLFVNYKTNENDVAGELFAEPIE